jgi:CHASE1-domain containing sensor protein
VARDTQNRMQIYFDTLHGMKGVYAVNDRIDRLHFHRFVTELKIERRYPGFQALQFVRPVPEAELPAFVERVKRDTSVEPAAIRTSMCTRPACGRCTTSSNTPNR